jgi:hypothetical protein
MKIWWDLVSPAGYGYNWGRSQGLVSYLDTLEIVGFLGDNPEFRPAPYTELAALYNQAWRWVREDYNDETHMFRVLITAAATILTSIQNVSGSRQAPVLGKLSWPTIYLRKLSNAKRSPNFPQHRFANVARFDFFAKPADKQLGVWLVRQGKFQFALPVTVGPKPGISDYLPAPHGLPGFSAPVEEVYPSMVPFLTLADGSVNSASDGADEIVPGSDGRSLKTVTANGRVSAASR